MCTVCGCDHSHDHGSSCKQGDDGLDFGKNEAGASVPGVEPSRLIQLEADILGKNNSYADRNRDLLAAKNMLALNLVSSPGSGKTTLLVATLLKLADDVPVTVIEGDQQTSNDAEKIRETGVPAVQINTGKGCHLDAHMVGHAFDKLPMDPGSILFIENVGNLVCPAGFDLGETYRVVILSVTEGEDKPLKYPDIFANADLMILNKTDLLPYLDFDVDLALANARRVNRKIKTLQVSAKTGEGMTGWIEWLKAARGMQAAGRPSFQAAE